MNQENSVMSGELIENLMKTVEKVDRGRPYFLNPEGQEEFAPGISKINYDAWRLHGN